MRGVHLYDCAPGQLTSQLALHELKCGDLLSKLFSVVRVIQRNVQTGLHDADVSFGSARLCDSQQDMTRDRLPY